MQEEGDQMWLKPNVDVGDISSTGSRHLLWMDTGTHWLACESTVVTSRTKN